MITLEVAWTCLRELGRALCLPLHLLMYLPRKRYWHARANDALRADPHRTGASLDEFLRQHPPSHEGRPNVFVSAGETSGEAHAAALIDAVREQGGTDARWLGFGGDMLAARGVEVLYPLSQHAIMGLAGVFQALPTIIVVFARFVRALERERPSLIVLVDYPGLHLVLAEAAQRRGIPVVHYIAPQYWAWGPWRMRRYIRAVDATLTILPFEPAFFDAAGLPSAYVGNPLVDRLADFESAPSSPNRLCILPGSRRKEIEFLLPGMIDVVRKLREHEPDLEVVLPHSDPRRITLIERILAEHGAEFVSVQQGDIVEHVRGARATLVKSGTGSLEVCLAGVPSVVVYWLHGPIARWIYRNLLTVPFFAAANLIAGRAIVPELALECDGDWDRVYDELVTLWRDGERRTRCLSDLVELRERLGTPGASQRAARWVVPFCRDAARH